jgi:hemerythrin-like domain-containing protein
MSEVCGREIDKVSIYMIKDHLRLLSLLHSFEMNINQVNKERLESFWNFKWYIEKHIFVEERALFSSIRYDSKENEEYTLFYEITEQHKEIINEIENLYHNLQNNLGVSIIKLRDLLNEHLKFEENIAYPKLDEIINDSEKTRLLNQMKDIICDF